MRIAQFASQLRHDVDSGASRWTLTDIISMRAKRSGHETSVRGSVLPRLLKPSRSHTHTMNTGGDGRLVTPTTPKTNTGRQGHHHQGEGRGTVQVHLGPRDLGRLGYEWHDGQDMACLDDENEGRIYETRRIADRATAFHEGSFETAPATEPQTWSYAVTEAEATDWRVSVSADVVGTAFSARARLADATCSWKLDRGWFSQSLASRPASLWRSTSARETLRAPRSCGQNQHSMHARPMHARDADGSSTNITCYRTCRCTSVPGMLQPTRTHDIVNATSTHTGTTLHHIQPERFIHGFPVCLATLRQR